MKIAMLARNPNLYSHRRLQQAAEDRGHQFDILNTLRCTVHIASHKPEVFYNGEPCIGYDAVIPRIGASITNYGLAILRQFDSHKRINHWLLPIWFYVSVTGVVIYFVLR